jgi:hypothetical protein
MLKVLSAVALVVFSVNAEARVYTCEVGGKKVFQSTPCAAGDAPMELHVPKAGEPGGFDHVQYYREQNRKLEEEKAVEDAIRGKRVRLGMTKEQVIRSWGKPDDINRSVYRSGVTEQWVYDRGDYERQYVYFDDGVVSAIN